MSTRLNLIPLIEVFDGGREIGSGLVSSAEGERILSCLLLDALRRSSASAAWEQLSVRPTVQSGTGRGGVLDTIMEQSAGGTRRRLLVEFKFWTARSVDHRRLMRISGLKSPLSPSTPAADVARYARAAWAEESGAWRDAWRTALSYDEFITSWPDAAKTVWPGGSGRDTARDQRVLAVWRPLTSRFAPSSARRLPPAFSPLCLNLSTAPHLQNQPRLFSGSLHARQLLQKGITAIPIEDAITSKIANAGDIYSRLFT